LLHRCTVSVRARQCLWAGSGVGYRLAAEWLQAYTVDPVKATLYPGTRLRPVKSAFEELVFEVRGSPGLLPAYPLSCLGGRAWDDNPIDPVRMSFEVGRGPLQVRPNLFAAVRSELQNSDNSVCVAFGRRVRFLQERRHGSITGCVAVHEHCGELVEEVFEAPRIVLAAGAIESSRLVLQSRRPDVVGVGENFTFTTELATYVLTESPRRTGVLEDTLASCSAISVSSRAAGCPVRRGKLTIYDALGLEGQSKAFQSVDCSPKQREALIETSRGKYVLKASYKGQSIPWLGKRVEHSEEVNRFGCRVPVIAYAEHPADADTVVHGSRLIDQVAKELGGTILPMQPSGVISAHQHGGLCFVKVRRRLSLIETVLLMECVDCMPLTEASCPAQVTSTPHGP